VVNSPSPHRCQDSQYPLLLWHTAEGTPAQGKIPTANAEMKPVAWRNSAKVEVLFGGEWWKAEVQRVKGRKVLIRYEGGDSVCPTKRVRELHFVPSCPAHTRPASITRPDPPQAEDEWLDKKHYRLRAPQPDGAVTEEWYHPHCAKALFEGAPCAANVLEMEAVLQGFGALPALDQKDVLFLFRAAKGVLLVDMPLRAGHVHMPRAPPVEPAAQGGGAAPPTAGASGAEVQVLEVCDSSDDSSRPVSSVAAADVRAAAAAAAAATAAAAGGAGRAAADEAVPRGRLPGSVAPLETLLAREQHAGLDSHGSVRALLLSGQREPMPGASTDALPDRSCDRAIDWAMESPGPLEACARSVRVSVEQKMREVEMDGEVLLALAESEEEFEGEFPALFAPEPEHETRDQRLCRLRDRVCGRRLFNLLLRHAACEPLAPAPSPSSVQRFLRQALLYPRAFTPGEEVEVWLGEPRRAAHFLARIEAVSVGPPRDECIYVDSSDSDAEGDGDAAASRAATPSRKAEWTAERRAYTVSFPGRPDWCHKTVDAAHVRAPSAPPADPAAAFTPGAACVVVARPDCAALHPATGARAPEAAFVAGRRLDAVVVALHGAASDPEARVTVQPLRAAGAGARGPPVELRAADLLAPRGKAQARVAALKNACTAAWSIDLDVRPAPSDLCCWPRRWLTNLGGGVCVCVCARAGGVVGAADASRRAAAGGPPPPLLLFSLPLTLLYSPRSRARSAHWWRRTWRRSRASCTSCARRRCSPRSASFISSRRRPGGPPARAAPRPLPTRPPRRRRPSSTPRTAGQSRGTSTSKPQAGSRAAAPPPCGAPRDTTARRATSRRRAPRLRVRTRQRWGGGW